MRQKSKEITVLLQDDSRLKNERQTRSSMRDRIQGRRESTTSSYITSPRSEDQERRDLERAIEESKRTAAEHERQLRER